MSIDSIDLDTDNIFSLNKWLESDEASQVQRHLEERIMNLLFSQNPESESFLKMASQLAYIGSRPEAKPLLEREIILLYHSSFEKCDFFKECSKAYKKVKNFVSDHATEIVVGAAICATGAGLAIVTGYTLSASVGGVIVAGAGSIFSSEEITNPKTPYLPDPSTCSKSELAAIQNSQPSFPKIDLPPFTNELLVTSEGIWASGQFYSTDALTKHSIFSSVLSKSTEGNNTSSILPSMNWKSFTYYNHLAEQLRHETGSHTLSPKISGERALALGQYNQAVQHFSRAIEANPNDTPSYLQRGAALFALGQYDSSLADYQHSITQNQSEYPLSVSEFTLGFAKGVPKGVYESGEGMLLFFADLVKHPIQTSKQVVDSITTLVSLAQNDEWGIIAESLSPEIYHLVTHWNTLPSEKRGELAGYALGKHGTDILAPGAIAKIATKSVKSAQELVEVCKNLKIAEDTLILETAGGIGNSTKIRETIEVGRATMALGEEVGLTAPEMGHLKQAGKLETTVSDTLTKISQDPVMQQSIELHKKAREYLKPHIKKPMAEQRIRELIHETGIQTFPRPQGIPEHYIVTISDNGAGMKYVNPENTHTFIRVMPGKPHSPFPYQQRPYINQRVNGKSLDKNGKVVPNDSPEAHIPIEEFIYWRE